VIKAKVLLRHLVITWALVLALCLLLLSGTADRAQALPVVGSFVPGEIIIKLTPNTPIAVINDRYNTRVKERFLDSAKTDIYLLEITDGSSTIDKLDEIIGDKLIKYAQPNYFAEAPEAAARHRAFPTNDAVPTDDRYSQDPYAASALNLSSAHAISKGAGTTVAVVDTGAQLGHPALKENFNRVARYDFVDDDNNPSEPSFASDEDSRNNEVVGHGTHVAGIVDLVAPKAKIMPLRVLDREGYGTSFHIAEAISFADRNGADVINLSLGVPDSTLLGLFPPKLLREKVVEANQHGTVVVAAAGNYNNLVPTYPAARGTTADDRDGLLAVTSVNQEERKSDFANYGSWVDIAAPGENILSTYPVSRYAYWSGTSMASPFVAGQAALIRDVYGSLDAAGVEKQIRCSARSLVLKDKVYGTMLGAGFTNVGASLAQPKPISCRPS
jgi:subtilisin family serine protease